MHQHVRECVGVSGERKGAERVGDDREGVNRGSLSRI